MELVAKLPSMEINSLTVLRENAERLEQSGTQAQKRATAVLLPALDTELAKRRALKLAASTAKRAEATASRTAARRAAKAQS